MAGKGMGGGKGRDRNLHNSAQNRFKTHFTSVVDMVANRSMVLFTVGVVLVNL